MIHRDWPAGRVRVEKPIATPIASRPRVIWCDNEVSMNTSTTRWVAVVVAIFLAGLSVFQILLAAGLPLGRAAFGGENRVLPRRLGAMSAFSALIFGAALYIDLDRSGLVGGVGHSSS